MKLLRPLTKEDTILLVIDPQVDFCSKEGTFGRHGDFSKVEKAIDNITSVRGALGERGVETTIFKQVYDPEHMDPLKVDLTTKRSGRGSCDINTKGHEFYRIEPGNSRVFVKYGYYNCFSNEEFRRYLRERGVRSLLVTGFDTHICVESTVRAGYDLGYQMVLLTDCIGGRAGKKRQENSIDTMSLYFAVPIVYRDLLKLVDTNPRNQRSYFKKIESRTATQRALDSY